jgi:release factor glutamine methyltransferase
MGKREFFGLELTIAPGVLIPRPDTETLVEEALRIAPSLAAGGLRIADVGCGSGAISIALAAHLPHAHVFATDIAPRALEIASSNAERHGLAGRMTFRLGDLLEPVPEPVHLITANLPYVASHEIPTLDPEIRMYEPREALDGGDDGLDVIRRLLDGAASHLAAGGALVLEMDPRQIEVATAHARKRFSEAELRAVPDLSGRGRVLVVQTH